MEKPLVNFTLAFNAVEISSPRTSEGMTKGQREWNHVSGVWLSPVRQK